MRRTELTILLSLLVIGLLAAFWLVMLSPKRQEASKLQDDIGGLKTSLEEEQQAAATGKQAQASYGTNYRKLVVLGKAVPADGDQPSLLIQLQKLADRSGVDFQSIDLSQATAAETAPAAPPQAAAQTQDSSSSTTASTSSSATTSASSSSGGVPAEPTSSATATEAVAATLPIGASIGPAGLPVMGYDLKFTGGFFELADFLKGLDGLVHMRGGTVSVDGRLLTVDGFSLAPVPSTPGAKVSLKNPVLSGDLAVTTYLTPPDQGITAGATPAGPAPMPTSPATPTPASTTPTTPTATATPSP